MEVGTPASLVYFANAPCVTLPRKEQASVLWESASDPLSTRALEPPTEHLLPCNNLVSAVHRRR